MEIDQIKLFAEVARQGSFAAAARHHGLDPSSVSRAIAALEEALGVRLFQRSTRRVSLTEAGATFLAHSEPALDELERAREAARALTGEPTGTLRLTTSMAFGTAVIAPALAELRRRHPGLAVELILSDDIIDLVSEKIDLAIRIGPMPSEGGVIGKLCETRYHVVASPDYADRLGLPECPEHLAQHRCLRMSFSGRRSVWRFRSVTRAEPVEVMVDGDVAISSPLALRDAARGGLGPAMLPDWLVEDDLAAQRLVDMLPEWRAAQDSFEAGAWVVYPSRSFLPCKTRAMIDFLKGHLRPTAPVKRAAAPAERFAKRH
ncbi:MAG: LysR family transcriptional regulator [Pseudomonadota bacterium]